jgi:hypothetical protein
MGMQSFRGAGGGGVVNSGYRSAARDPRDPNAAPADVTTEVAATDAAIDSTPVHVSRVAAG